jgi:RNA polymerase sigma-70 factor (ECF subfamily)
MFDSAVLGQALISGESHPEVADEAGLTPGKSDRSEEARLIAQCLAGNSGAFAVLVRPHLTLFTSGIQRILQNQHETQDALQEALLSIHAGLHLFPARDRFPTWAYRICLNEALLRRRSQMRQRDVSFEPFVQADRWLDRGDPGAATQETPTHRRWASDLHRTLLRTGLTDLSEEQRLVFVLRDLEGMDTEYVARKLGISRALVREHRHRALLQLRDEQAVVHVNFCEI